MQPKVSVIIASYNHREYVKEAVKSVLNQGVKNIEVIVVDDGSADGTPDEVERIKDRRLKLVRLKENRREYPRNIGLAMARGEFIAFQNSDDKWERGKLKKQLAYLDQNPESAACFTQVGIINEESKPQKNLLLNFLFRVKNKNSSAWLRYFFDNGNCLFVSSALIRRDKIEQAGRFKANLFRAADLDLWVRLAARGELYVIPEKLTLMRITNKNFSRPSPEAQNCSNLELTEIYENYTREPILSRLPDIFDKIIPQNSSEAEKIARLALYSWDLSAPHILFANQTIGRIISQEKKRQELTDKFGAEIIKKYINNKSVLELNINKSKSILNLLQRSVRRLWQ